MQVIVNRAEKAERRANKERCEQDEKEKQSWNKI